MTTETDARHWALIPAAGSGSRVGADRPKQYLEIHGRTILDISIGRILHHPLIHAVYLAIAENDPYWKDSIYVDHADVVVVKGGRERCDSVLNALTQITEKAGLADWVLVHDAARPCIRETDISRLMHELEGHPVGGLLGIQAHDTMKQVSQSADVEATIDRNSLWHAQTPQMFRLGILIDAMTRAGQAGIPVTDESSAIEWAGLQPRMVQGHADNVKITLPEDIHLATHFLDAQMDN